MVMFISALLYSGFFLLVPRLIVLAHLLMAPVLVKSLAFLQKFCEFLAATSALSFSFHKEF